MDEQMKQAIVADRQTREMQAIEAFNGFREDMAKSLDVMIIIEPFIDNGVIKARVRAQSMT